MFQQNVFILKKKKNFGVPQGSTWGSPLFLLSVDKFATAFENCIVHHFTDHTYLIYGRKGPSKITFAMDSVLLIELDLINALSMNLNQNCLFLDLLVTLLQ